MYADDVKIIAVDFDGVLCENKYPEIGLPNEEIFEYLESEKKKGTKLILWTCRTGGTLTNAVKWCAEHGLIFDAVNENVKEIKDVFGDGRKVFANEYIDDRMNGSFHLPFRPFEEEFSLDAWAENEIRLACQREREDGETCGWDYGVACYQSALKAFYSLLEDGHSGMSICFTKNILDRLIDGKPLSPIEDDDKCWTDVTLSMGVSTSDPYLRVYQCVRYSSLLKYIKKDGSSEYDDYKYSRCVNVHNRNLVYHSGFVSEIINHMFPITFPYFPAKPIDVYCDDFLANKYSDDDFDTVGIFYAVKPDGTRVNINRYFKQSLETNDFIEISEREYQMREDGSTNA